MPPESEHSTKLVFLFPKILQRTHELSKKIINTWTHEGPRIEKKWAHEDPCMRKEKAITMPSRSFHKGEGKTTQMESTSTSITRTILIYSYNVLSLWI
jgi:hypothetical protein